MKSSIFKALALSGFAVSSAMAGSLYDSAPTIGIPESYAVSWAAHVSLGYDSNINSSPDAQESAFVRAGVSSAYGEFESADKISYNVGLGVMYYMRKAYSTNNRVFPDITLGGTYERSLGSGSRIRLSANVAYQPEPDYSNGISSARARGNTFMWNVAANYSRPIDTRLSWVVGVGTSGYMYEEREYRYDDRQYVTGSLGLNYKSSPATTYGLTLSYRLDRREYGENANNIYLNASATHALDSVSSVFASVGLQSKHIDDHMYFYPNFRAGYNRQLTEGLSANLYVNLDNENIGTYAFPTLNYLSDMTWRLGARLNYTISPMVTVFGGVEWLYCDYSRGTNGLQDMSQSTYVLSAGLNYAITKHLSWNTLYKFTDGSKWAGDYTRSIVQTGFSYSF